MIARLGIPTASCYDQILTPSTYKPAASQDMYGATLMAEWLLGRHLDWGTNAWVERGTEMEEEARKWYEFNRDAEVQRVGFVQRDDGKTGGSPDGLVGDDGGLEIKCLGAANHALMTLRDPLKTPDKHVGQVQGYLYLTGRKWWDILFYNPDMRKVVIRVEPDPKWQEAFVPTLNTFLLWMDNEKAGREGERNLHPEHPEIKAALKAQEQAALAASDASRLQGGSLAV
jgi:hypothetical protein